MAWEEGISIPTRERCGVCYQVSAVGFHVPDDTWLRAVPDYYRNTVLCLRCFISFADERLLCWEKGIQFFPVSLRSHLNEFSDPKGGERRTRRGRRRER